MTGIDNFALFLLRTDAASEYFKKGASTGGNSALIFLIVIAAVVVIVIVVNLAGKRAPASTPKAAAGSSGKKLFNVFAFRRTVKNLGLNHDQIKMLDFVFKTDDVTDPEKSLNTPSLLDHHFKRAYRVIGQQQSTEAEIQNKLAMMFSTRNMLENSLIGGLSSTRQLPDDTILTISVNKEKINVAVVSAKTDTLTVETPKTVLGSQIKISKGTKLNVLFFTKNNKGFSFETRVLGFSTLHGHPVMLIAHSNQLKFLSQRRFRRKQAVIACSMKLVYVEGSGKKQRLIVDKRKFTGNIADISVGGCSIKTAAPVQVGAMLKIEFTQGEKNIAALGQVLRTNRTGINTTIHLKFLRVTKKSMNLINAFVYEYADE
jgi:c-di-GMP-binding flagellar brake protein YcgR